MKGLNERSTALFMQLVDQMGGQQTIRISQKGLLPLTLTLVTTDIFTNSSNTVGNLYNLSYSYTGDETMQNPGMQFLVIDRRLEKNDNEAVEIFPVSYREDAIQIAKDIILIVDNRIQQVNLKWQREYARFANQWIRKMSEMGYFKVFAKRGKNSIDLVCICGNNFEFDGYDYCDEAGNLTQATGSTPTHFICRHCKRIIDLETLEVIGKQNTAISIETSFAINKPIISMTSPEKAKLLHVLCPDVIRAFLTYVDDTAKQIITSTEAEPKSTLNETLSATAWKELAKNVSQIIATSMNRLVKDSDLFALELFAGYNMTLLSHCIQEYMSVCENSRVTRGIEFIFDL